MRQFMSEKIGSAKGSRLDEDFVELERVSFLMDIINFCDYTTLEDFHQLQTALTAQIRANPVLMCAFSYTETLDGLHL